MNLIRDSLTWGFRTIGRQHNKSAAVILENLKDFEGLCFVLGEAAGLCGYTFDKYKTKDENYESFSLEEFYSDLYEPDEFNKGMKFAEAQIFSREIINEPGCSVWPEVLAEKAEALAKEYNLACEIWDEKKLESEKMGGILFGEKKHSPLLYHFNHL